MDTQKILEKKLLCDIVHFEGIEALGVKLFGIV